MPEVHALCASCWLRSAYSSDCFARDAVLHGAVLGGDRHRAAGVRIVQAFPQPVFELALAELEARAQAANDVRHLAHVLHAAGEHDAGFVQLDVLRAADHRLDAGAAQRLTVSAGTSIGSAGLEADVTRAVVRVDAALLHVAEHDVIDPLGAWCPCVRARAFDAIAPSSIADKILERADVCASSACARRRE